MIFGKYINRYYLRSAPVLLLGLLALLTVDYIQLMIPELYRLVINGVNLGEVAIDGQTLAFTKEVLFQHICLPMIWIVLLMVVGRFVARLFLWLAVLVTADLRERSLDHSRPPVPAILPGQQGRQPDEPLHQRPRHHSGVLRRRHFDVL